MGAVVLRGCGRNRIPGPARPEVLLVRRGHEPMAGSWSLPGGAIELGETAAEACVREVREECGLDVEVIAPVETVDIIVRDDVGRVRFHYLIVDMLCRTLQTGSDAGDELAAADDASAAVWADVHDVLEEGAFSLTARACTVIRKALEHFSLTVNRTKCESVAFLQEERR